MKRGGERTRLDIRPDKMRFKSAVRISCRKRAAAAAQRKRQAAAERKALKEVAIGSSGTLAEPKRLPKQREAPCLVRRAERLGRLAVVASCAPPLRTSHALSGA